jgi:small GTP-binding protein
MDGVLLIEKNFIEQSNIDMQLVSGFISAIQSFSKEMTGSSVKSINFEDFTYHLYIEKEIPNLFYIFITDLNYNIKEINCKVLKISSIFIHNYLEDLLNFMGDVSSFNPFDKTLSELKIAERYCGNKKKCILCPYRRNRNILFSNDQKNQENIITEINNWFSMLLNQISELLSALLIDFDGFIITHQKKKSFDEGKIELITKIIEPILEKTKRFSDTLLTSGFLDTNKFRLFYLEMGGPNSSLLIIVSESYYDFENILSYIFIIAEKVSSILNGHPSSQIIPRINAKGNLHLSLLDNYKSQNNLIRTIYLIGDANCGKTSFINMIINEEVDKEYKPTIGLSIYKKEYHISKYIQIKFLFFEIGGVKTFAKVKRDYYSLIIPDILIIMFDFTKSSSTNKLNDLIEESIYYIGNKPEKMILIGNKKDLKKNLKETSKQVTSLREIHNCAYFEISSLNGNGIDEVLAYIISNININIKSQKM